MIKLFLFCLSLHASESFFERFLLRASTLSELRTAIKDKETLEFLLRSCEYELKKQKIPRHCYKLSRKGEMFELKNLDSLCLKNSEKQTRIQEISGLSRICASAVESRNAEIRYSELEKNPIQILRKE